jgi:hypothetical protein
MHVEHKNPSVSAYRLGSDIINNVELSRTESWFSTLAIKKLHKSDGVQRPGAT